uniref:Girdin-like n=1 Tax=Nicotiana sylvestris TaxID=4096 RepID=A0A1U7Y1H3_NICSY|nr:PREDICTED: girdin-like [Nicotiana sylvestris]
MSFPERWNMKNQFPRELTSSANAAAAAYPSAVKYLSGWAKVEEPKADSVALTPEVLRSPRAEGEEIDDSSIAPERGENLIVPYIARPVDSKSELDDVVVLPQAKEAFDGVSGNVLKLVDGQNIPGAEVHSDKVLYNQTFARFQAELTHYEGERRKLTLEVDELRAIFTKKVEEFRGFRDCLEAASRKRTHLTKQLEKKDVLMREELRARDTEILQLKWHVSETTSKRDTLHRKVVSIRHQLHDARAESNKYKDLHTELVVALSGAKAKTEALVSSYKEDVVAANAQARKVSEEDELQLTRAVEQAWLESRKQALEDKNAGGIDLSTEIERVKTLEEEVVALLTSEGESSSGSKNDEDEGKIPEGEEAVEDLGAVAGVVEGTTFEGAIEGIALMVDLGFICSFPC